MNRFVNAISVILLIVTTGEAYSMGAKLPKSSCSPKRLQAVARERVEFCHLGASHDREGCIEQMRIKQQDDQNKCRTGFEEPAPGKIGPAVRRYDDTVRSH